MKNKATHIGTCQYCACQHKLPGGVLANHGYTVEGCHIGTCPGSKRPPFEISAGYIAVEIAKTEAAIANFVAAVVPVIYERLSRILRATRKINHGLTQEECSEANAYRAAVGHNQRHEDRKRFVAFHKPRIAKWVYAPERLVAVKDEVQSKQQRNDAKAEARAAKRRLTATKVSLSCILTLARGLAHRFDSQRVFASSLEEYEKNREHFDKANKPIVEKCAGLYGTHATALKVAAYIRSIFTDRDALNIAEDLEKWNSLLTVHKDDYLKAEAAAR